MSEVKVLLLQIQLPLKRNTIIALRLLLFYDLEQV